MKRISSLLFLLFALVGCASPSSNSGYSGQDIMFAEMMIPHHEQAITMSDLASSNSSNPAILELANRIKTAQAPEIEEMKSWPGVDASSHMGHQMNGMLSDDEIKELEESKGGEFDRLFLEGMIKHHQGAIDMAEMVVDSRNKEVAALASAIISAQRAEIAEMKSLLRVNGD